MSDILLFWIGITVGFIILELLTATFYGLSLALASAGVALYVYITNGIYFDVIHAVIFTIGSALFAYFLPKMLQSKSPEQPQGSDRYIGLVRSVKKVGGDYKISLDGVDYLIDLEDVKIGEKVKIIGHQGVSMKVLKV